MFSTNFIFTSLLHFNRKEFFCDKDLVLIFIHSLIVPIINDLYPILLMTLLKAKLFDGYFFVQCGVRELVMIFQSKSKNC